MVNRLIKYKEYFHTGLWHIHTNFTDGENSIFEYCEYASINNIKLIGFTEHVRKELDYDFDDYIEQIKKARILFPNLIILIGCEAKVLDIEGNLDVSKEVYDKCDLVLGAFHSFPYEDKESYLTAMKNMLKNQKIDVFAHPFLFAKKKSFTLEEVEIVEIIKLCEENEIILEKNKRYKLPSQEIIKKATTLGINYIIGRDIHTIKCL
jgi:putative hydrolase